MTEAHIAGHATHFLRRLDRVRDEHVETALALYRDEGLLREVLGRASVPERAERLAIALAPGKEGPFVVVTRDGKFVTCLGEGMTTGDLFVVSRERLDVAAAHVDRMRERLAAARALEPDKSEASRLWERLLKAGAVFPREDFQALARWEPLLARDFLVAAVESDRHIGDQFVYLRTRNPKNLTRADEEMLHAFYLGFWAWAHTLVLMHVGDTRERIEELTRYQKDGQDARSALTVMAMRYGIVGPTMRAIWAVGRHAKPLLPSTKDLPVLSSVSHRGIRSLALGAIAHASSKSRAEAERALQKRPAVPDPVFEGEWSRVGAHIRDDMLHPEAALVRAEADLKEIGYQNVLELKERLPEPITNIEAFPSSIGLGLVSTVVESWISDGWVLQVATLLPRVVTAAPEEFFLPRAWAKAVSVPYEPAHALRLLSGLQASFGKGAIETVRKDATPGRNDPCSCGSGKKYKRCCG